MLWSLNLVYLSQILSDQELLVQEIKDLMRHGKVEANHPRMNYAHFWTKTVNNCGLCATHASLKHRTQSRRSRNNWCAREVRQNSLSQLTQPAYSVRGMSCLNPLGYVRSKFPAKILISLSSLHLLWTFSSPTVASH